MPLPVHDSPIVIIGAGFSGTLLAVNLLRHGARVVLVERDRAHLGRGLAFGTPHPEHLLNVRASNMSAYPDDLGHFQRWMDFDSQQQANLFVPRATYGSYLREQMMAAIASAPARFTIKEQEAVGIDWPETGGAVVHLDSGEQVAASAVVLALGNLEPAGLAVMRGLDREVAFANPWNPAATENLGGIEQIVLIGTGLTAVDVAISLDSAGYRGRITAISRRGLRPRAHTPSGPHVTPGPRPEARGSALLRQVRHRAADIGWRSAVDELRPHMQSLWRLHDPVAQGRLLRHARPWWDVHRHRLAPPVADRVATMQDDGRLHFCAGRLVSATAHGGDAHIVWRPRGSDTTQTLVAQRVITCTGPESDVTRCTQPLLQALLAQGRMRPDPHRLGVEVDQAGRVVDTAGTAQDALLAVGPVTRGAVWEIVAVPDIRRQVWTLARALTHSQWVGGEGL
ncbi:FAD/NAD(P)-binding protein [Novosphingobium sp.]|uniref:FAD/NAD(P)-binding protein n=1 Tax=Novosphingobium sp. TaxID=1874826 RepID=UPI003B523972